jgi:hypothetical protein
LKVGLGKIIRDPRHRERSLGGAGKRVFGAVFADRAALHTAGKAAPSVKDDALAAMVRALKAEGLI